MKKNGIYYVIKSARQKICNSRVAAFFLLMFMVSWEQNRPVRDFAKRMMYPSSWCVFPFLLAGFSFLSLFWFGVIYVNSDIPFMQYSNMYHVIRTGRTVWGLGQIGGILIRSVALVMGTALCSILTLLPMVEWSGEWGKLLHTAALRGAGIENDFQYVIFYGSMQKYTPLELFGLTAVITALAAAFVSLMMFAICLYINKMTAVAATMAYTILLYWVLNAVPEAKHKISYLVPAIWPQVARSNTPVYGRYWFPPVPYIIICLIWGILMMSFLILVRLQKCELNWEHEDM